MEIKKRGRTVESCPPTASLYSSSKYEKIQSVSLGNQKNVRRQFVKPGGKKDFPEQRDRKKALKIIN